MTLEVLYFDGCPGYERLMPELREQAAAIGADLVVQRIEDSAQAVALRFLGSPSVRVDGLDVEPGAEDRVDYGLKCRLYRTDAGQSATPPSEWIERALHASGSDD